MGRASGPCLGTSRVARSVAAARRLVGDSIRFPSAARPGEDRACTFGGRGGARWVGSGAPRSSWWPSGAVVRNGRVLARRPEGYRGTTLAQEAATTPDRLLERDRELEAIRTALLDAAQDTGAFVVIGRRRPASARPRCWTPRTRSRSTPTARAPRTRCGARARVRVRDRPPAVRGWCEPGPALFTGAARVAAPLLGRRRRRASSVPADDPYAARHALYWLLRTSPPSGLWPCSSTTRTGPTHVAGRSRAHRQPARRVASGAARREPRRGGPGTARRRCAGRPRRTWTLLHVQPLGAEAAAIVVRSFAPSADDALCRACHVATGGNPFLLSELLTGDR